MGNVEEEVKEIQLLPELLPDQSAAQGHRRHQGIPLSRPRL